MAAHPLAIKVLIPIQLALSSISIPSGALLLSAPGGEAIGAQTILPRLTQSIPFLQDFTAVGVFLLLVYGLLPLALILGLWRQKMWAWTLTLALGITEVIWILAEVALFYDLGFFIFYPIIAGMGIVTVFLCLAPSVRSSFGGARRI